MDARTGRSWRILSLLAAGLALGGPVQAATLYFAHTDAQGSVVAVTDSNRNVVERREYEPYGLPRQPVTDDPGYTGHVHDADSGLVYMQQRYYDAETGRFLSVDPVGVSPATGGNFNRYWYANNNPYTFVDPDGMCPRWHPMRERLCAFTEHPRENKPKFAKALNNASRTNNGESSEPDSDVVGNDEMDALAVERLLALPYIEPDEWIALMDAENGSYSVSDFARSHDEARASIVPNRNTVAILHAHPRYTAANPRFANLSSSRARSAAQFRNNANSPPGRLDHLTLRNNRVNYYRDSFGNVRVVERAHGEFRVRTIYGVDFPNQRDWRPR